MKNQSPNYLSISLDREKTAPHIRMEDFNVPIGVLDCNFEITCQLIVENCEIGKKYDVVFLIEDSKRILWNFKVSAEVVEKIDLVDKLNPNFPNPFCFETEITYSLSEDGDVVIRIFDINGRSVKTFVRKGQTAGKHVVLWEGIDETGSKVAAGLYFYQLQTENFNDTKKMLIQK